MMAKSTKISPTQKQPQEVSPFVKREANIISNAEPTPSYN